MQCIAHTCCDAHCLCIYTSSTTVSAMTTSMSLIVGHPHISMLLVCTDYRVSPTAHLLSMCCINRAVCDSTSAAWHMCQLFNKSSRSAKMPPKRFGNVYQYAMLHPVCYVATSHPTMGTSYAVARQSIMYKHHALTCHSNTCSMTHRRTHTLRV